MSKKNRNGNPTEFQKDTLKNLGATPKAIKAIKTYRDAENAIKRLRNAARKSSAPLPVKKGDEFCTPDGKKLVCEKVVDGEPVCKIAKTAKKAPGKPSKASEPVRKCKCSRNGKVACKCHSKPNGGKHCAKREALVKKDAVDRLPVVKNGFCVERISLPRIRLARTSNAYRDAGMRIYDAIDALAQDLVSFIDAFSSIR